MSKHDNYMTTHIIVGQFSNICEREILVVEHLKSIRRVLGLTLSRGRRKGATLVLVSAAYILKNVVYKRKYRDAGISMAPAMDNTQTHILF